MKFLVVGIGSSLHHDDVFGLEVLKELSKNKDLSHDVRMATLGTELDLLLELKESNYRGIIIVDAVDKGGEPGTLYLVEPEIENLTGSVKDLGISLHEVDLSKTFALAKRLGLLPKRVLIVGCQPKDTTLGIGMSGEVKRAVSRAVKIIREKIKEWEEST